MSLKEKTLKSLAIIYSYKLIAMGIGFFRTIVITRLLFPKDFAVISLAYTIIYFVEQLFSFGFSKILIRKEMNACQDEMNVAFTLNVIQNTLYFIILYLGAPYCAIFYHNAILELVIRILGIKVLLQTLGFLPRVILTKELKFGKIESLSFASELVSTLITLALAYAGWSFWSIIVGTLASSFIQSLGFIFLVHFKPVLFIDLRIAKQYIQQGVVLFFTAILTYITSAFDVFFIGKLSGFVILGYYTVSKTWARYFLDNIFGAFGSVLFPAYAQINKDKNRTFAAFLTTVRMSFLLLVPIYVGFFLISSDFVLVFLGNKWEPSIRPLQILILATFVDAMTYFTGPLGDALGRFDVKLKMVIIKLGLLVVLFIPGGLNFGNIGYCFALLMINISIVWFSLHVIIKHELRQSVRKILDECKVFIIPTLMLIGSALIVNLLLPSGEWRLIVKITAGFISFVIPLLLISSEHRLLINQLLKRIKVKVSEN